MELRADAGVCHPGHSEQSFHRNAAGRAWLVLVVAGSRVALAQQPANDSLFFGFDAGEWLDHLGTKVSLRGLGTGMDAKLARAFCHRRQSGLVLPRQTALAAPVDFYLSALDH